MDEEIDDPLTDYHGRYTYSQTLRTARITIASRRMRSWSSR
jgi:hypothetical protein